MLNSCLRIRAAAAQSGETPRRAADHELYKPSSLRYTRGAAETTSYLSGAVDIPGAAIPIRQKPHIAWAPTMARPKMPANVGLVAGASRRPPFFAGSRRRPRRYDGSAWD